MNKILQEYLIIGLCSLIFGYFTEKLVRSINENNYLTNIKKKNNIKFVIVLILYGFLFHFIIEYFGINKWQCEKMCYEDGTCNLICKKKI